MITSSLPPELKVMIASAVLLGGGLLALRFPADREETSSVATNSIAMESGSHLSSSPPAGGQTTFAASTDDGARFVAVETFINQPEGSSRTPDLVFRDVASDNAASSSTSEMSLSRMSTGWSPTSLPTPAVSPSTEERSGEAPDELSATTYANIPLAGRSMGQSRPGLGNEGTSTQSTDTIATSQPAYVPFQASAAMTMPEPNPAFFSEHPRPPTMVDLPPIPSSVSHDGSAIDSPSVATSSPLASTSIMSARPIMPPVASQATSPFLQTVTPIIDSPPMVASDAVSNGSPSVAPLAVPVVVSSPPSQLSGYTVQSPTSRQGGNVIYAPVRTVILPH